MKKNDGKHSKSGKHYYAIRLPKKSLEGMYCDFYTEHAEDKSKRLILDCDAEHTYDNFESFYLCECDNYLRTSFNLLTEHLLDGYWAFNEIYDLPIDDKVVEELSEYLVTPHLFSASYAKYLHSHSNVKYFYNQKDRLIILSKGLYRPAAEAFAATPGCDIRTFFGIFAMDKLPDNIENLGCDELFELIENDSDFWISYHGNYRYRINLSINIDKIERQVFLQRLQDACKKSGKELPDIS